MKVKVFLDKNESRNHADDLLLKALQSHQNGDVHGEDFSDPAVKDVADRMSSTYEKILNAMLQDILNVLDIEDLG